MHAPRTAYLPSPAARMYSPVVPPGLHSPTSHPVSLRPADPAGRGSPGYEGGYGGREGREGGGGSEKSMAAVIARAYSNRAAAAVAAGGQAPMSVSTRLIEY